ncbi:MAG: DUF2157 domain-containing protein, partial [Chryseolinea sp.]
MSKQLLRALPELIAAGIIDNDTADRIKAHYEQQDGSSPNRLFIVFGILGGLLVGLGIILILAHNWDDLSRLTKVIIGLLPLVIGQVLTGWLIFKPVEDRAWREGVAAFLFCAIGVSIAIVSQVYNMGGDLADFLLAWMALSVPVIYVLGSGLVVMLCVAGITWYASELSYFSYLGTDAAPMYWVVLAVIAPYYYYAFVRPQRKSNFYALISWLLVISLSICLATVAENTGRLFVIAYMSMYSLFVMAGESDLFKTGRVLSNSFLVVGSLGVMVILLMSSFVDFWAWESTPDGTSYKPLGITVIVILALLASVALFMQFRSKGWQGMNTKAFAFLFYIAVYFVAVSAPQAGAWLINICVLTLAIYTIRSGAKQNHLGILNYGLVIITALIMCRFFDTD